MAKGYYGDVSKLLKKAGYSHVGNFKGSHQKWEHKKSKKIILVAYNMKSRHTANNVLKTAGISKKL